MSNMSDNYYLRKCYLKQKQVPTLSMIKKKMTPPLADVYFKSMKPRHKELAGLEPSLKGGGNDWYIPPKDLLNGRAVLKPVRKAVLAGLSCEGIVLHGTKLFQKHRKAMDIQIEKTLLESDMNLRNTVKVTNRQLWDNLVAKATEKSAKHIMNEFNHFTYLYRQSIGKIEILFHESAVEEIKNTRDRALQPMQNKYETSLKYQATSLYDEYEKKLMKEKARLKDEFIQSLEIHRTLMADKIHDLNVDKHKAIEKIRQCLQCQNLACQIYVALKEREECLKENEELKYTHKKTMKGMADTILNKDIEICLAQVQEKKRQEFCKIWQKKVCTILKSFQKFVSYCLHMLPEHAEFFISLEKLMLLQLNETLEDPTAASIIEVEREQFNTPIPQPRPFYLFCDRGYKVEVDRDLCPKRNGHSSASDLPVVIINKRCLYAACDNFKQFTNKITEFIQGNRGDDADIKDDLVYEHFIPVKFESSQQLLERKLESSLLQVLQQEIASVQADHNTVPIECNCESVWCQCLNEDPDQCYRCGLPWCSCQCPTPTDESKNIQAPSKTSHHHRMSPLGKSMELDHEREPKWESFCRHIEPKKCSCAKTVKKHLAEHLPVYMTRVNKNYGPPDLPPNYEMCSVQKLKSLVNAAKETPMPQQKVPSKTKDFSTQCYLDFECICNSESQDSWLDVKDARWITQDLSWLETSEEASGVPASLTKRMTSFATFRAFSLSNLLEDLPDLKEIFYRKDSAFE